MSDSFNLHKGEMALASSEGIEFLSDSKDMFLFSEKKIKFSKDFKFIIDFKKITKFGGFQLRFFYDYHKKVFYSLYFIHSGSGYEIRCINNNNEDYRWSFSRVYGFVPEIMIYKGGENVVYWGKDFCKIKLISINGLLRVFIEDKCFCEINIYKEFIRDNSRVLDIVDGLETNIGFDACISQNILYNLYYENINDKIMFNREDVLSPFFINFKPEVVFDFYIDLEYLEDICKKKIFNKIIICKSKIESELINEISKKYDVVICFTKNLNLKYLMSMTHEMFTFVVKTKYSPDTLSLIFKNIENSCLNKDVLHKLKFNNGVNFEENSINFISKERLRSIVFQERFEELGIYDSIEKGFSVQNKINILRQNINMTNCF